MDRTRVYGCRTLNQGLPVTKWTDNGSRVNVAVIMAMPIASLAKLKLLPIMPSSASVPRPIHLLKLKPAHCASLEQQEVEVGIMCEPCNGKGWVLCDFCEGQKTNVKAQNNRIYRRCPSCRAVGYVLCSKCKVFKCVTFPNSNDGEELYL